MRITYLICRLGKGLFEGPSSLEPLPKGSVIESHPTRPLPKAVSFAIVCQHACFATILALLQFCRPPTIAFFVVSVVVDSINGCLGERFMSHVLKKVNERRAPAVANDDSPATVVVVFAIAGVVASAFHLFPRRVFRGFVTAALATSKASARLNAAFAEVASGYSCGVSTLTATFPVNFGLDVRELNDSQASVDIPRFVCGPWGKRVRIALSHLNLLQDLVVRADRKLHTSGSACCIIPEPCPIV